MISSLDYENLVVQKFEYLVTDYGYTLLSCPENSYFVSYVAGGVTVEVMYDACRSHELDVRLSYAETRYPIESFSLYEIVQMGGSDGFRTPQVVDGQSVSKALENCAMTLKKHGDKLLRGDKFNFRRLSKYRDQQSTKNAITTKVRMVRADVEIAWKNGNYINVFSLLDSIREHLSDAELKKLAYSRKKAGIK